MALWCTVSAMSRRRSRAAEIADAIREDIRTGRLGPGEKLPPIADYMDIWDTSLGTVRSAQGQLADEGLLERLQGVGVFVSRSLPATSALEDLPAQVEAIIEQLQAVARGTRRAAVAHVGALRAQREQAGDVAVDVATPASRALLGAAGLDTPESLRIAEQLAGEVLARLHPGLSHTPGRLMVATVQVARDPAAAYVLAGYDPMPENPDRAIAIRTARERAAYARADWLDVGPQRPGATTRLTVV